MGFWGVDGSALSFNAKAAEARHVAPFGVKLAEELNDRHHTQHVACTSL
ncbi:MAG: hypothetical protein ACKO96_21610 [Flammeovirgaceae bacterium]